MLTAVIAGLSAALYGVADFLGGLTSRRVNALAATVLVQAVGFVILGVVCVVIPPESWSDPRILWGLVAGVMGGCIGVLSLYAGLAAGRMSVVAPITASLAAAVPALVGFVQGERLGLVSWVGIALALVAVVIVSITPEAEPGEGHHPGRAVFFAVLSGLGFAASILAYSRTPASAAFAPLLLARVVAVVVLGATALVRGSFAGSGLRAALPMALAAGVADTAANAAQVISLRLGPVSIAAVIGSLYPAFTVLLARFVLHERMHGWQRVGIAMALVAVVLTAWPT